MQSDTMIKKVLLPLLLLFSCSQVVVADEPNQTSTETEKSRPVRLPTLGISHGVMSFIGDIGYHRFNEPLWNRSGLQFDLQYPLLPRFSVSAFLLSGRIGSNDYVPERPLNFRASIVSEGVLLRYEWISNKMNEQILIPYITGGIGYTFFMSKADLKDGQGRTYHYWSDGSIRDLAEDAPNAADAVRIYRDYDYETDLRDANLDGFGKYRPGTLTIPAGAGVRMRISGRCSIQLGTILHLYRTDLLESVNAESAGSRKGNSDNDKLVFTSAGFRYDFSGPRENSKKAKGYRVRKEDVKNIDFNALLSEDADGDGVPDVRDDSAASPEVARKNVDVSGKPVDTDYDGIPDYRDKEPNSGRDAVVTEEGITITQQMVEEKFRRDSLEALPAVREYLQSFDRLTQRKAAAGQPPQPQDRTFIPSQYLRLDRDLNGTISPNEVSAAIDEYMEGKSPYTVAEFYQLIDYFFGQRR